MKKIMTLSLASMILSGGSTGFAQTNQEAATLANQSGCMACHKVEEKLIGPGFKDVADKYKDQPGALETLTQKVKKGGSGNWGRMPMPPHSQLSDETIKTLVTWVLRGAPAK